MSRSGQRWLLVAAIAVLLTACRGSVVAAPGPTATTPPAIVTTTLTVATTAQPTVTPITAVTTSAVTTMSDGASLAARPLHPPALAAGAPCPVTSWQPAGNLDRADFKPTSSYFAFGPGPVYPIIYQFDPDSRTVHPSRDAVSGWTFDKVLWLIAPSYRLPALVRVLRLDPPIPLSFFHGRAGSPTQTAQLQIPAESLPGGWQTSGSGVRFSSPVPGCYAFQVDGLSFSNVIAFNVTA